MTIDKSINLKPPIQGSYVDYKPLEHHATLHFAGPLWLHTCK